MLSSERISPQLPHSPIANADAARLSPLIDTHLNVHGTYTSFFPQLNGLRPLRDPTGPDPDADGDTGRWI